MHDYKLKQLTAKELEVLKRILGDRYSPEMSFAEVQRYFSERRRKVTEIEAKMLARLSDPDNDPDDAA